MTSSGDGMEARQVSFAYGTAAVVRDVSLSLQRGDRVALAGPNGSGKTTLLRLLGGSLQPHRGQVTLNGEDTRHMKRRELARRVAVVAQHIDASLGFTVENLVAMGRTPYLSPLGSLSRGDRAAVRASLDDVEASHLAARHFSELSGGEQQRVMVALALAQQTEYLLLDEPTVHLDLHHQHQLLELLSRLQQERRIGLLAVMHDLNLSSLYFDRIAVMSRGALAAQGPPDEILSSADVLGIFRAPLSMVKHPRTGAPQVLLDRAD